MSATFSLAEAGRQAALEAIQDNQYLGAAPVPLGQYVEAVQAQKLRDRWLTPDDLAAAYKHMVVTEDILSQIGPAVNAGKSFLICGQPGNGKTYLAEALFNLLNDPIYIPYAIECQGRTVQLYDPVYHKEVAIAQSEAPELTIEHSYDGRWFRSRRPFITTGGELTLDMLDLSYNPTTKVYDAPFQLKANNGIYLIDDFGRQRVSPTEVLNRWIIPMERRVDYLNLQSGGKVTVPFECFLIFSTNLKPSQLGDEAFLRRIQYKMHLASPALAEFVQIFERFCNQKELGYSRELITRFIERNYVSTKKPMRRCHPRDVLSHALDLIAFESRGQELDDALLDRAFESCFLDTNRED